MSYSTPHHAHEYLKSACLSIVHEYTLACQRKSNSERRKIVLLKQEIDLCARLAMHFGPEAGLAAQGSSGLDLVISSPTLRAEVKYLRRKPGGKQPVNLWNAKKGVKHDWDWLLSLKNVGDAFKKTCLVFFLPSQSMLQFHEVCDVKASGAHYLKADYAPFVRLVRPDKVNPNRLVYQSKYPHDLLIRMGGKVIVRRQLVGSTASPIWALIYTRVGTNEYKSLTQLIEVEV
jgi:hypothetical protein